MNTPEISIEEQAEAYAAWKRGEEAEWWDSTAELWRKLVKNNSINDLTILRRKPKPKLRPWKPEEVPVGALQRIKGCVTECATIIGYDADGIESTAREYKGAPIHVVIHPFDELLLKREHSIDGGKTWLPCGVVE